MLLLCSETSDQAEPSAVAAVAADVDSELLDSERLGSASSGFEVGSVEAVAFVVEAGV